MKHIKKKFLFHHKLEGGIVIDQIKLDSQPVTKELLATHNALILTDTNDVIGSIKHREGNKYCFIPEPDLVVCLKRLVYSV